MPRKDKDEHCYQEYNQVYHVYMAGNTRMRKLLVKCFIITRLCNLSLNMPRLGSSYNVVMKVTWEKDSKSKTL